MFIDVSIIAKYEYPMWIDLKSQVKQDYKIEGTVQKMLTQPAWDGIFRKSCL